MNQGRFDAGKLIACYAPPSLRSVMPGNKVMLRSGGPEMTACNTNEQGEAVCQWMADGQLVSGAFPPECLTCYGAR